MPLTNEEKTILNEIADVLTVGSTTIRKVGSIEVDGQDFSVESRTFTDEEDGDETYWRVVNDIGECVFTLWWPVKDAGMEIEMKRTAIRKLQRELDFYAALKEMGL